MIPTPRALADAAEIRKAVAVRPPSENERVLTETVVKTLPLDMPVDRAVIGEALIQIVQLENALIDRIRDLDPALDWESTVAIALNVMLVAGAELLVDEEAGA